MTTKDITLCTFISGEENLRSDAPDLLKKCCPACAWKEEQLHQVKQLKRQSSTTEKLLQSVANKILLPPSVDESQVLVKKVKGPLTERQIRYASILSHAIQCRSVSHDDPSLNLTKKAELLKLHELLKRSFPTLYRKHRQRLLIIFVETTLKDIPLA